MALLNIRYQTHDLLGLRFGDAVPTSGTWGIGDYVINTVPTSGAPFGWVCTVAGSPGTWRAFGDVAYATSYLTLSTQTMAPSASVAAGTIIALPSAAAGTLTLSPASGYAPGARLYITPRTTDNVTLAAGSGDTLLAGPGAAVTSVAPAIVISDGVNTWYRVS